MDLLIILGTVVGIIAGVFAIIKFFKENKKPPPTKQYNKNGDNVTGNKITNNYGN